MPPLLRVAVVGLGVGRAHLWAWKRLAPGVEIVAVCDHDDGRLQATAERFPTARAVNDLDDLLGSDDVDVVDLCTPPFLHVDQVQRALAAGHHVVCEKPVVGTVADVDTLQRAADAAGRWVMPIFQYRYGDGLRKLRALVDAGLAGRLHTATVEVAWKRGADYYAAPGPSGREREAWRGTKDGELGGVLLTHAVHAIDMLTWIAGPVTGVAGARVATRVNDIETEDCAAAVLELAGGALATLSATLGSLVEITRHRFCFERLTAESGTAAYTSSSDPWSFVGENQAGVDEVLAAYRPQPEQFLGQFSALVASRRDGGPLPVTLADARAAIAVVEAIHEAAAPGPSGRQRET